MSQDRPNASSTDASAYSSIAKTDEREQLADDVERFLKQGGNIDEVPKNYRADPPRKPESNYGRGSI